MVVRAVVHAEPIPGYKLIERLGGGGFGEVWKCEAPGGILKAIKFVFGTLTSVTEDGGVQQELKSLNRVKSVRHPYILSLERYDIIDGQLMIVMELADKNLWERFKECQAQGMTGISREELLRLLEEAAEALDLMNIQYGLQHLDIKPQNLFLVHSHLKVADFGLVKDLEGMNTQVTGGVTPLYAAPETFDGVISRYCDQYNLAIVYQELLTGQRPYLGTNARQLMMQHLTGTPDLSALPECDREPIARALSKKPEDRFPSCTDLLQALRQGKVTPASVPKPVKPAPPAPPRQEKPAGSAPPRQEKPADSAPPRQGKPAVSATPAPAKLPRPPVPTPETPPILRSGPTVVDKRPAVEVPERRETTGDGVLFPAVIVGLGGLGLKVVRQLRASLHEHSGPSSSWPHLQFLYIDTDPVGVERAGKGHPDRRLKDNEVILARLQRPSHYLKPVRNKAALDSWLNLGMLCRVPRNQTTTEGLRFLGRLALADNYREVVGQLRAGLEACTSPVALSAADRHTKLGLRTNKPRVYIIAGLGGGTGSGMFIDVAYIARSLLRQMGYRRPDVAGLLLLPSADFNARQSPALVNAFAALTELHHFSTPDVVYTAFFDDSEGAMADKDVPFSRCIVLPLPEEGHDPAPTRGLASQAGDFLCRDLLSPLGRELERARTKFMAPAEPGITCQTFGSNRFFLPRRTLLARVGRLLAHRLVHGWLDADRAGLTKAVRTRIEEQCGRQGLEPEGLIAALQSACAKALGKDPDVLFADIIHKYVGPNGNFQVESASETLEDLEKVIGQPAEEGTDEIQSPMVTALDEAAEELAQDWEKKFADLACGLMEDPKYRLGGAECAAQQLLALFDEVVETHQSLLQELAARGEESYLQIGEIMSNMTKGSWWPGRMTKLAEELQDVLAAYPRLRYQTVVLECLVDVYEKLRKQLPRRLEEFGFFRQRLGFLLQKLEPRPPDPDRPVTHIGPGRAYLPAGASTLEEAIDAVIEGIRKEDLAELDRKVEQEIRRRFKSLRDLCMGTDDVFGELPGVMLRQAEELVEVRLGKESAAARYLSEGQADDAICADLAQAFEEAAPALGGSHSTDQELRLLTVPADPAGERLAALAKQTADHLEAISAPGEADVYFCRELPHLPLADLPQLSLMAEDAYRQMTAAGHFSPHTRADVPDWKPAS